VSVWQRVVATLLVLAAGVVMVVAFVGDDSQSSAAPRVATTPVWSVRRVPQPVVDAVGAQHLQNVLDRDFGGDNTCFYVMGSGAQLAAHNVDTPLIGASTQKILVAAATLTELGPDFTYETKVVAPSAPHDGIVDKMWFVGGGDPVIATDDYRAYLQSKGKTKGDVTTRLETLADSIVNAGVKRIPGGIVADDSRYDDERYVPDWGPQYAVDGDVGPLGALTVNDGWRSWTNGFTPVTDPAANAATQLARLLTARGVQVGPLSRGVAPGDATVVAKINSPPLRAVVGSMLSSSDNNSAEEFTKELAFHATSKQGTTAAGVQVIVQKLQELGIPTDRLVLKDGSGLDRGNRVTCRILVAALALGVRPELRELWDGLPVAGQTGTLFDQLGDTRLAGKMRGKTGSLDGVSGLIGMVDLGRSVTFAFLDNGNFTDQKAAPLRAHAANLIGTYPDAPAADALVPKPAA
jgi:D-alanyl-D-alanine carboxypeptidase/D-alanyl-D-alanine-endopeptidase (penicillin-binding protein 4)